MLHSDGVETTLGSSFSLATRSFLGCAKDSFTTACFGANAQAEVGRQVAQWEPNEKARNASMSEDTDRH